MVPSRDWKQLREAGTRKREGLCWEVARDEMRVVIRGWITTVLMSHDEKLALCLKGPPRPCAS